MDMNIDIVERALQGFLFGEPAPSWESPEFATLIVAIKSLTEREASQIGSRTLVLMLNRMSASMGAEKALKIMRGDGDQNKLILN